MPLTKRKVSGSTQTSSTPSTLSRLSLPQTFPFRLTLSRFPLGPENWTSSRSSARQRRADKAAVALRDLILDPSLVTSTPCTSPHPLSLALSPPEDPISAKMSTSLVSDESKHDPRTNKFKTWSPYRASTIARSKTTVPRLRAKDIERLRTQLLNPTQASMVIASAKALSQTASEVDSPGAEPMRAVCLDCLDDKAEDLIRQAAKVQKGLKKEYWVKSSHEEKFKTVKVAPIPIPKLPVLLSLLGVVKDEAISVESRGGTGTLEVQTHLAGDLIIESSTELETPRDLNEKTHHHRAPTALTQSHTTNSPATLGDSAKLPFGLLMPASAMSLSRPLAGALPTPETLRIGFDALLNAESKIYLYQGPSHVGIHPPLDRMSIYTYWWGFELALPPPTLEYLSQCKQISTSLLNLLGVIVYAVPGGTRELAPFVGVLSRFIETEWRILTIQDQGRGVVCGATWFIPAALVARPWDFDIVPGEKAQSERSKRAQAAEARAGAAAGALTAQKGIMKLPRLSLA